jgi:hypothetical protein
MFIYKNILQTSKMSPKPFQLARDAQKARKVRKLLKIRAICVCKVEGLKKPPNTSLHQKSLGILFVVS